MRPSDNPGVATTVSETQQVSYHIRGREGITASARGTLNKSISLKVSLSGWFKRLELVMEVKDNSSQVTTLHTNKKRKRNNNRC